ncbi:MAG: hypothetical protein MJE77_24210 [Proteobacteria bacterium]|nr:hypothetical protein [Pseudomonadota bacterium]
MAQVSHQFTTLSALAILGTCGVFLATACNGDGPDDRVRIAEIDFGHPALRECALEFGVSFKTEYADGLPELGCPGSGIDNLRGVEHFVNVTWFNMSVNPITDIEPIRTLDKLEIVELNSTGVSDLSPLVEIVSIRRLWLQGTNLTAGVNRLSMLVNLQKLVLVDAVVPCEQLDEFAANLPASVEITPPIAIVRASCR